MKHIKTYESILTDYVIYRHRYKIGDYVLYRGDESEIWINHLKNEHHVKIVNIRKESIKNLIFYYPGGTTTSNRPYIIKTSDGEEFSAKEKELIRKLTKKEIEEYNMIITMNKYNL